MRIFIAALLPEEIIDHISSYMDSIEENISGVKWEKPEKLHITLKFLGDIDDIKLKEVNRELSNALLDKPKMNMCLSRFGAFPALSRPRVLYMGFDRSPAMIELQGRIDTGLTHTGFQKEERNFIPHVTIGRVKSRFKLIPPLPIIDKKDFSLDKIAVVRSIISSRGSEYKNLEVYVLN